MPTRQLSALGAVCPCTALGSVCLAAVAADGIPLPDVFGITLMGAELQILLVSAGHGSALL